MINTKRKLLFSFFAVFLICAVQYSHAHPGRLDRNGGHHVWTSGWGYEVGTYHYHRGPNAGDSTPKKPAPKKFASAKDRKPYVVEIVDGYRKRLIASSTTSISPLSKLQKGYANIYIVPLPSIKSGLSDSIQLFNRDAYPAKKEIEIMKESGL